MSRYTNDSCTNDYVTAQFILSTFFYGAPMGCQGFVQDTSVSARSRTTNLLVFHCTTQPPQFNGSLIVKSDKGRGVRPPVSLL